jgi:hypothetical protein
VQTLEVGGGRQPQGFWQILFQVQYLGSQVQALGCYLSSFVLNCVFSSLDMDRQNLSSYSVNCPSCPIVDRRSDKLFSIHRQKVMYCDGLTVRLSAGS